MRKQILATGAVAMIVGFGAAAGVLAQGADKAADVLAASRRAIGDAALDRLKTFSLQAQVSRNVEQMQMNTDVEVLLEMPGKYLRTEASTGPMTFSSNTGFNGDRPLTASGGGMASGGGGHVVIRMGPGGPMPGEKPTAEQQAAMDRLSLRDARHEIARMTLGWFGAAHPVVMPEYSYAGEAEAADGKADVIDVKGANGFAARLFVDKTTHFPLMLTYQGPRRIVMTRRAGEADQPEAPRSQGPTLVEYRIYFADWSDVDGIKFPLKIQRAVEGTPEEEWTITKVKVNPKIDEKKFQVER